MNGSNWQIEQSCPQCGAPVTLDETDRLLACPFCRTRLYLVPDGHFHYCLPPAAGLAGEICYVPYWRLRGSSFAVSAAGVTSRFVDLNTLAANLPLLPFSLGLRPQVLKLRFVSPATEGRFLAAELPADQAILGKGGMPRGVFYQNFIGETVSLIHAPIILTNEAIYDAVCGKQLAACKIADQERLLAAKSGTPGPVRFIPTLCPHCGWDMEGEKDSLALICRNCNSVWACPGQVFEPVESAVISPPPGTGDISTHLPFWRMKVRIAGMELSSYADLIRLGNLPKVITPAFEAAPLYFWSPAFKVNPALYLRWARQMTIFQPGGDAGDRLPATAIYPVTLPLSEATEGVIITLAQIINDKRTCYPKLPGLRASLLEARLEFHPFTSSRNELLHAAMKVTLDKTALSYGIRL